MTRVRHPTRCGTLPDDKFNVDNGGSIIVTQSVTTTQTINADLHLVNATVSNSSTAPFNAWRRDIGRRNAED